MKLRYLFSIILSALLFAGCAELSTDSFDNIKLDKTYVTLSVDGGTAQLKINATESWAFDTTYTQDVWPNVIKRKSDKTIDTSTPSWLSVDKMKGDAGESVINFSAEAVSGGRELELCIKAGMNSQFVKVRQGSLEASSATCAEVNAGPDGKTYRVKGTVTSIANTLYGNWYLNDGTGEVYVYGTLDKDGKPKNFESHGIEVGDVVEVEGPKLTYGTTVELVDVTVLSIKKAFAKLVTESVTVEKEGGEIDVMVAYKGEGLFPSVPEEYRSWVSILDVQNKPGQATKIEPNPADTAVVKISVLANTAGDRSGSVVFTSSTTTIPYTFSQKGAIIETTADKINAAADGETVYRITGVVKSIANGKYGNIYIADYTGEVYVYGTYDAEGNRFDAFTTPVKEGDIVTVSGVKGSHNGNPQMKNVIVENHISVKTVTVAEFLAAPVAADVYYRLSGTMAKIVMDKNDATLQNAYGNFDIVDESGSVYVYGLLSGWGGPKGQFRDLKLVEGDKISLVGVRADFKGTAQVGNAFFVSKVQ